MTALDNQIRHKAWCDHWRGEAQCNCGAHEAIAELEQLRADLAAKTAELAEARKVIDDMLGESFLQDSFEDEEGQAIRDRAKIFLAANPASAEGGKG